MKKIFYVLFALLAFSVSKSQNVMLYIDKDNDGFPGARFGPLQKNSPQYFELIAQGYKETIAHPWISDQENSFIDCDDHAEGVQPFLLFKDEGDLYIAQEDREGKWICVPIKEIPGGGKVVFPEGWIPKSKVKGWEDCNSNNPLVWKWVDIYRDNDLDGYRDGFWETVCWNNDSWPDPYYKVEKDIIGIDQKNNSIDCDDYAEGYKAVLLYKDEGDFWVIGAGEWKCVIPDQIPSGYITPQQIKGRPDCEPNDPAKWREEWLLPDPDGDKHVPKGTIAVKDCIGDVPAGKILEGERLGTDDCDPGDGTKWRNICIFEYYINTNQWVNTTVCWGGDPHPYDCRTFQAGAEFTVYPNPVSDRLIISPSVNWNERVDIKLTDQYARVVRTMQVPNAVKGQTFTINTSDLKPGIYQLTIRRGELIESKTIAVKL